MAADIDTFAQLIDLESHGPDTYLGVSPVSPWPRVYGGQVIAQGLQAALHTVADDFHAHSVHAYFIRGGDVDEPIRYEVDRIRNGRSFVTRRVVARQSGGAILNLSASFQTVEDEADVQTVTMPDGIPPPEECESVDWGTLLERRGAPRGALSDAIATWIRVKGPLESSPRTHACALAYASDEMPTDAASAGHPLLQDNDWSGDLFMGASLDHTVWFHRAAPVDEWQLHVFSGQGLTGGRGLAFGHVFTSEGRHVASVTQEILLRRRRPSPP